MMFDAFTAPGRFWKGNLHGHSDASDGRLPVAEVCAAYRGAGYDFIAVTDHFLPRYGFPVTDTAPFRAPGFTTLIGAEMHAPATEAGELWHILAVGLPAGFAHPTDDETGPALARRCAEAGAFVAIAHPQWYGLTQEDGLSIDAAHAVEVYNHTSAVHCDRGGGQIMLDALLTAGRRLGAIAVDDSHWHVEDGFGGWVMVKAPENTPGALLAALKAGQYYASEGPEISDIRREGDEIVVECSAVDRVILLGPASRATRVFGQGLTTARLNAAQVAAPWCRVVVVDSAGRRAWSNPLWLEG
ncbi:phosphotransferase [Pararhodobacter sp.]|uniref:phosphotransferase n=1 Tax=Pararhodobacter sp. TaxID=2127056 RepID=UPI002FDCD845